MIPAYTLPAKRGKAIRLKSGEQVKVVNLHGKQVVDTWAFAEGDPGEFMSMEHTRSCLDKLTPGVGDDLFTNRRRPILRLEADTSPGIHDTLLSACDEERYRRLGFKGRHGSCAENFRLALEEIGVKPAHVPGPLNLFENVSIGPGRTLAIAPPVSRAGDAVTLRAMIDAIVVFSACPMDMALTNGADRTPKDVRLVFE
jgi:uncharacterized protein YcgI (DUF1989 family)